MASHYYTPYISDEDASDSDNSGYTSDTSYTTDTFSGPGSEAPTLVVDSGVPEEVDVPEKQITAIAAEEYDASRNTSLIMINSRDRDTHIYPQPTYFTIRMPRTFKNIKSVAITQLNLLNSFFNFSQAKGNTYMYVNELGRVIQTSSGPIQNDVKVQIRDGTYSASELVDELNNSLNQTPLFSDISGGIGRFIELFKGTGDYSLLFNEPGPVSFNSLTGQYESDITMNQLVARYFQTVQTVGTVSFTDNQCLVAYYYPIIKEMTARNLPFNLHPEVLPAGFPDPYTYILFGFTGLDDPYILTLINDPANIPLFNTFHDQNTFLQFLVNNYVCTYNSLQGRLQISATSLNPSIQTDITNEYQLLLSEEVVNAGFSNVTEFQTNYNSLSLQNGALLEFYNFIHRQFTNQFGINFGTYTPEFFADLNNELTMYNTNGKRGWFTSLVTSVSANQISNSQQIASQVSTPLKHIVVRPTDPGASGFLSNVGFLSTVSFSNASETTFGYTDISFSVLPTSYARLNFTSRCRQTLNVMTIPRYLNERGAGTEEQYPYGPGLNQTPMLFDIDPTPPSTIYIRTDISGVDDFFLYTIAQNMFASRDYMRANDTWAGFIKPQVLAGNRVQPGDPEYDQIPPVGDFNLVSFRPHMFFQVNIDGYALDPTAKWKVDICVETQDATVFPVPVVVTRYKDRAAFMMDVADDLSQGDHVENPRHYFDRQVFTDISAATLTIDVTNFETSYITVHLQNAESVPSIVPLRVFAILNGTYGVYTTANQLDYRGLPWQQLSTLLDQVTPNSEIYKNPLSSIYDSALFQLGYDISGVSNNWLDYYIQSSDNKYFDPATILTYESPSKTGLRYLFEPVSNGAGPPPPDSAAEWSLYFYPGSQNIVRDTYTIGASNVYLSATTPLKAPANGNQQLLVNWFRAGQGIVEEYRNPAPYGFPSTNTNISISSGIFMACVNSIPRVTDMSTSGTLDTTGLQGLSFFMNPNDLAKLNEIQMKFAYIQPSFDPLGFPFTRATGPLGLTNTTGCVFQNEATVTSVASNSLNTWDDWYEFNRRNVRIGVFDTAYVSTTSLSTLSFSTAICTLTLEKVTQVGNFTNTAGTIRSREPDWGTYYKYCVLSNSDTKWVYMNGAWQTIGVSADVQPMYQAGESNYPGYFLTHPTVFNNNYLPLGYGIAPSVGYSTSNPYSCVSSYVADIPNSYTIVPFYFDTAASEWKVGGFYGNTYTKKPALPNPTAAGLAAPYYGPPGIFGWTHGASTLQLATPDPVYWNMKIGYETLDQEYDPATDLAAFGGYTGISNEYQDTVMFFYENQTEDLDIRDISTTIGVGDDRWVWGQESNTRYKQWDDQNGYNYLSYINNLTIRPTGIYNYAIHVRGYVPTSQFNTGLRLIGKNFTDFGTATLTEIGDEIADLAGYTPISEPLAWQLLNSTSIAYYSTTINTNNCLRNSGSNFYSHQYADALLRFNDLFKYPTIIFGKKIGYNGVTFTLTGYQDAIQQYSNFFTTLRNTLTTYTAVLSTTTGRLNQYVRDKYANVLPSIVLNRTRITDPIPFSLLLNSKLESPYNAFFDEWGLGWNLGFNKADTPYLTTQISNTFIRITQDYIYLKLNEEMNMNLMGVSAKEDLSLTREPFAESNKYFAKILLNNFGGFCRAAVMVPKIFTPVLGQFQTLSLQLVDRNGNPIDNNDCEYDIVLEFTEIADRDREKFAIVRGA